MAINCRSISDVSIRGLSKAQAAMAYDSGDREADSRLVVFLYLLMRDKLPSGAVEDIMSEVESIDDLPCLLSNGWLATHAGNVAKRLTHGHA